MPTATPLPAVLGPPSWPRRPGGAGLDPWLPVCPQAMPGLAPCDLRPWELDFLRRKTWGPWARSASPFPERGGCGPAPAPFHGGVGPLLLRASSRPRSHHSNHGSHRTSSAPLSLPAPDTQRDPQALHSQPSFTERWDSGEPGRKAHPLPRRAFDCGTPWPPCEFFLLGRRGWGELVVGWGFF